MDEKEALQTLIYAACESLWMTKLNKLRPSRKEIRESVKQMFKKSFEREMTDKDTYMFF